MLQPPTTSTPSGPSGSDVAPPPPPLTTSNPNSIPHRRTTRRATISETPTTLARRSSLSVHGATVAIRSTVTSDNPEETWHSVPLAFAVLPALGGLLFTNGSLFITDILLLFLVAVFLHWLVKFPWYKTSPTLMVWQLTLGSKGMVSLFTSHKTRSSWVH
jgi:hypothetical protein